MHQQPSSYLNPQRFPQVVSLSLKLSFVRVDDRMRLSLFAVQSCGCCQKALRLHSHFTSIALASSNSFQFCLQRHFSCDLVSIIGASKAPLFLLFCFSLRSIVSTLIISPPSFRGLPPASAVAGQHSGSSANALPAKLVLAQTLFQQNWF
jgi:hypothetical protein